MRGLTRNVLAIVLALSPLVALASCSSSNDGGSAKSSTTGLTANPWGLVSFTVSGGTGPAEQKGRDAVLTFAKDGTLSGTTGCNNFGGSYKVSGSDLTITMGPMTLMACADPALTTQEQVVTTGLGEVTNYSVVDGTLLLRDGSKVRFTYRAAGA